VHNVLLPTRTTCDRHTLRILVGPPSVQMSLETTGGSQLNREIGETLFVPMCLCDVSQTGAGAIEKYDSRIPDCADLQGYGST